MKYIATLGLGLIIAWVILSFTQVKNKKSYFTLRPFPLEEDNSNLALVGVGLASAKPKPSVMDATPASTATPVMMEPSTPASGSMTHIETATPMPIVMPSPAVSAPTTMMPPQLTPAPMPVLMPMPTMSPSPSV